MAGDDVDVAAKPAAAPSAPEAEASAGAAPSQPNGGGQAAEVGETTEVQIRFRRGTLAVPIRVRSQPAAPKPPTSPKAAADAAASEDATPKKLDTASDATTPAPPSEGASSATAETPGSAPGVGPDAAKSWPSTPTVLHNLNKGVLDRQKSGLLLEALKLTDNSDEPLDTEKVKDLTARRMSFVRTKSTSNVADDEFEPIIRVRFNIHEKLGSGGYAEVYKATDRKTGEAWALKVIFRDRVKNQKRLDQEIEALRRAQHPSIIRQYETIHTKERLYLVQDLAAGGCLFDLLIDSGGFEEVHVAIVMQKMFSAVAYLHSIGIVHRDIKLENILLTTPFDLSSVKLSDFGVVRILEDASKNGKERPQILSQVGSVAYMAPEIFLGKPYDESVDMWACGVLLYMLLSLASPFGNDACDEDFEMEQINRIINVDYNFDAPIWKRYSAASMNMINRLLRFHPIERLSANEALRHPWIRQLDSNPPTATTK